MSKSEEVGIGLLRMGRNMAHSIEQTNVDNGKEGAVKAAHRIWRMKFCKRYLNFPLQECQRQKGRKAPPWGRCDVTGVAHTMYLFDGVLIGKLTCRFEVRFLSLL